MGYRAELTTDDQGDPKIKSSASGSNFSIFFYGCNDGSDCTSIQFSAGFDMDNGTTLTVANEWNAHKRYGQVYLDEENDPFLEMDVNLDGGGVSEETFRDTVGIWDKMLAEFQQHIDW